ncbi:ABC transporter permease [Symbiobacterium thermophilum]|uniref:ABC transporter permease protein n=2 Tax=Symbiobacterium thermophilum TaxID=2734 RepID=Q67JZ5_SYMTH|nr:ABC transporter permease [Symbiobacterium thermophilum]MBY6275881.1 ABC transporter permease [Symbiobacterium thermophilum]OTA42102.1 MAG: ABC transporter permease [Symbiobacterium thermophilum]BAD42005.1 ABC transporter permease protein [Symbiobacterium thermophilum IAM 14863]
MELILNFLLPVLQQGLVWGLVALGVWMTFRVVNVPDLTVDGTLTTGAATAARLLTMGVHPVTATLAGFATGAAGGAITGLIHTRLRVQPLLASIITMTGLYSINLRIMGRSNIALFTLKTLVPDNSWARLALFAGVAALLVLLMNLFFRTELGLALRATGDNDAMVRMLGVSSDSMRLLAFTLSNAVVGLGGALVAQYSGFADAQMGIGTIVASLAALIIGEALFGSPTVFRATLSALLGSIIYRAIFALALRAGFQASDLKLVTAALVVIALSIPQIKRTIRLPEGSEAR